MTVPGSAKPAVHPGGALLYQASFLYANSDGGGHQAEQTCSSQLRRFMMAVASQRCRDASAWKDSMWSLRAGDLLRRFLKS
jgi:hypothetical protein